MPLRRMQRRHHEKSEAMMMALATTAWEEVALIHGWSQNPTVFQYHDTAFEPSESRGRMT